jgi:dUTP pyrophosphatase
MPIRKTADSAGYDMVAVEDYIIPSLWQMCEEAKGMWPVGEDEFITMDLMSQFTKKSGFKPVLVSTGVKCELDPRTYLQLSVRSSCPLKNWLIMANGVGVIDADYYDNPDNEGEIFFQIINLSPFHIHLKKGDRIGQGIFLPYHITDDDNATEKRNGGFGSTSK